uniref:Uncharacterized protein n=1 Tax=Magallana gigas TaxID=29159 RepID=A0A8W8J2D5_MAGGI
MSDWVDMSVGTPAPGVPVMASTAIKRRRMDEESVGGASEQSEDFQESYIGGAPPTPHMSWITAHKGQTGAQGQMEAAYGHYRQGGNLPPMETEGSEASIGDFESPRSHVMPPGYYGDGTQNIEDPSHSGVIHHLPPVQVPVRFVLSPDRPLCLCCLSQISDLLVVDYFHVTLREVRNESPWILEESDLQSKRVSMET